MLGSKFGCEGIYRELEDVRPISRPYGGEITLGFRVLVLGFRVENERCV